MGLELHSEMVTGRFGERLAAEGWSGMMGLGNARRGGMAVIYSNGARGSCVGRGGWDRWKFEKPLVLDLNWC